jgi:hypothetical protein
MNDFIPMKDERLPVYGRAGGILFIAQPGLRIVAKEGRGVRIDADAS